MSQEDAQQGRACRAGREEVAQTLRHDARRDPRPASQDATSVFL
jgi:hypothetical protein